MKYARFILILIMLMAAHTVCAAEGGYIVQVDQNSEDNARLFCVPDENVICRTLGIYYAENEAELEDFCSNYDVISYSEDCEAQLFDVPNDKEYSKRWDAPLLDLPHMWDYDLNLGNVNVAIIDSGVASGHEDIDYDRIIYRYNAIPECEDTEDIEDKVIFYNELLGHGTSVAGTIGAKRNNGVGAFGVADGVNFLIFKVTETQGFSYSPILTALGHIIDNNLDVDVINMSLGALEKKLSGNEITLTQELINELVERGIIVVASVGNNGNTDICYPAACNGVIGVGAIENNFYLASFSQRNDTVFVTAPGKSIYLPLANGGYSSRGGTSFSSPYVAAIAAYAKAVDKDINYDEFLQLLKYTSLDRGDEGYDTSYGWGVVQPALLMDRLAERYSLFYKDRSAVIADMTEENGKTTFTLKQCGRKYSIFVPEYSGEVIKRVQMVNVDTGSGEVTAEIDTPSDGARLFIWDEFMRPVMFRE